MRTSKTVTQKKLPPSLIVADDSPDFGVYPMKTDEVTVGRSPDNYLQLSHDPTISRVHMKIKKVNDSFRIYDMRSANGTFVNDTKIIEAELHDRDEIRIGQTKILFRTGSGEI